MLRDMALDPDNYWWGNRAAEGAAWLSFRELVSLSYCLPLCLPVCLCVCMSVPLPLCLSVWGNRAAEGAAWLSLRELVSAQ